MLVLLILISKCRPRKRICCRVYLKDESRSFSWHCLISCSIWILDNLLDHSECTSGNIYTLVFLMLSGQLLMARFFSVAVTHINCISVSPTGLGSICFPISFPNFHNRSHISCISSMLCCFTDTNVFFFLFFFLLFQYTITIERIINNGGNIDFKHPTTLEKLCSETCCSVNPNGVKATD